MVDSAQTANQKHFAACEAAQGQPTNLTADTVPDKPALARMVAEISLPDEVNVKPFFRNSWLTVARRSFAGVLCFSDIAVPQATMGDVRKLAAHGFIEQADNNPELAKAMLWTAMKQCEAYDGYISEIGDVMLQLDSRPESYLSAMIDLASGRWPAQTKLSDLWAEYPGGRCSTEGAVA